MSRRRFHRPNRQQTVPSTQHKVGSHPRSAAIPPPSPPGFVGVPTLTKMSSASRIAESTSGLNIKFLLRTDFMTSHNPGSKMGREEEFQASMRAALESTTVTWMCGFFDAMTAHVGAPIPYQPNLISLIINAERGAYQHIPRRYMQLV
jgi:hypothetical protein